MSLQCSTLKCGLSSLTAYKTKTLKLLTALAVGNLMCVCVYTLVGVSVGLLTQ